MPLAVHSEFPGNCVTIRLPFFVSQVLHKASMEQRSLRIEQQVEASKRLAPLPSEQEPCLCSATAIGYWWWTPAYPLQTSPGIETIETKSLAARGRANCSGRN